jgi:predicted Zn-dependent peptidase
MTSIYKIISLFAFAALFYHCSPKTSAIAIEDQSKAAMGQKETFRATAPTPAPAPKINIGQAESFNLDNGLQVIVVENHKIPQVSFQIALKNDPIREYDKVGYVSMAGELMGRGTKKRSKAELDEAVDFIGALLNTSSGGMFASALTKHTTVLLDLMTEVLYEPSFPAEELEKIKKQTLSGLEAAKTDPGSMMNNMSSKLLYGPDHVYGEIQTVENVANIDLPSIKEYYEKFFIPNNAYLVIVGDVTNEEAKSMATKYFGSWKNKPFKPVKSKEVTMPQNRNVAFAHKDGAVQSVIKISYPIDLQPGTEDVIKASVMNTILGGGFSSRLMQNLREDKAYTYGARSSLSSDPLVGSFSATANVRNEVTDSSVYQFLYELERIKNEPVGEQELQSLKNYMTGGFARSLESPQTIARFAVNKFRYNLPDDYYETYLEKLNAVTVADIQEMAQKYIKPESAYVFVVGNKDDVAESLTSYDADGKIDFYDAFGKKMEYNTAALPMDLTAASVVEDYLTAIGGMDKVKSMNTVHQVMKTEVMGQSMKIESYYAPEKFAMSMGNGQMTFQEQKYDGQKAMVSAMGQKQVMTEGEQYESLKEQSTFIGQMMYFTEGYALDLKGIEDIEGVKSYKVLITKPNGSVMTEYYSMDSGLLLRNVSSQNGPQGSVTITSDFMDYADFSGLRYPSKVKISGMMPVPIEMRVESLEINKTIDPVIFIITE